MFNRYFLFTKNYTQPPKWQNTKPTDLDVQQLRKHVADDHPIGIALGDDEFVIDIDPRDGGVESAKELEKLIGGALFDNPFIPKVTTGRGGLHLYFKNPKKLKLKKTLKNKNKTPYFPGIDFLSKGANVVSAGSRIPPDVYKERLKKKGKLEEFDESWTGVYVAHTDVYVDLEDAPDIPDKLAELLVQETAISVPTQRQTLTTKQLAWALEKLDPKDFSGYEDWRDMMFAVKSANGTENAKELFLEWSERDEQYKHSRPNNESLWYSATSTGITANTLLYYLAQAGVTVDNIHMLDDNVFKLDEKPLTLVQSNGLEVTQKPRIPNRDQFSEYYYVASRDRFVHVQNDVYLTQAAFNSYFREEEDDAASKIFLEAMNLRDRRMLDCEYQPYKDQVFSKNNAPYLNTWVGHEPEDFKDFNADIKPWLDHVEFLFSGNKLYIELFHKYLAALFQKCRRRLNFALVVLSKEEGIGKTTPLNRLLCKRFMERNAQLINNDILDGAFNSIVCDAEVVIFEEAEKSKKGSIINKIKPWISDERILRHQKTVDAKVKPNFASYIVLTNNTDALAISEKDRRFLVLEATADPPDSDYFPNLYDWLDDHAADVVNHYCKMNINFKAFCQRAPKTSASHKMRDAALSSTARMIVQIFIEDEIPHADKFLLTKNFYNRYVKQNMNDDTGGRLSTSFTNAIEQLGYIHLHRTRVNNQRLTVRSKSESMPDVFQISAQLQALRLGAEFNLDQSTT